jgi:hypothetical protein
MVDTERLGPGAYGTVSWAGTRMGEEQRGVRPTTVQWVGAVLVAAVLALAVLGVAVGGVAGADSTDPLAGHNTTVTVVSDNDTVYGQQTADLVERGINTTETPLTLQVVDSTAVDESLIQETDAFVFHYVENQSVAEDVIPAVENDSETHAVYVEQYDFTVTNAIFWRAGVLDDPNTVNRTFDDGEANNVSFEVQAEHPLFEGVGEPGDTVLIHQEVDSDRVHFTGADGETLAEVGIDGQGSDGPVAAVDPDSGAVLLGTIAPHPAQEEPAFTDAAAAILGNAVLFGVETEPPEVSLSDLDIAGQGSDALVLDSDGDVSANVTHVGGGAGEVNVTVTVGNTTVTETAQVDVGEQVTVTAENVTGGVPPGNYTVTVATDDDELLGTLLVSVDATDDGQPATDTSGDGLLDDIDGDGSFDIFDVQALFGNFERDVVQDNPGLFNFNGDDPPVVTIFDVQALFGQLEAGS